MDLELNYDREPPDMHDHSFEDLSHYLEREFRYLRNLDSHHSTDEAWATLVPLRIALRYKCVASYFAEHHDAHVGDVDRRWVDYAETGLQVFMKYINGFDDKAPHKLRLAFLKMCCNLFNTHLCRWILTSSFIDGMINVCVDTLLRLPIEYATMEPESPIDIEMRIHLAAARLACNIAATDAIGWVPHIGVDGQLPTIRKLSQSNRLELTAALIHALTQDVAQLGVLREKGPVPEDAKIYNTTDVLMRALGWFLFSEWKDGSGYELRELCKIYTIGEVLDVLEGIARFDALAKELKMLVFRIE